MDQEVLSHPQADWHHMDSSDNDVHSIVGTVLLESGFRLLKDVVCVKPNPPAPHFHPFHRTVLLGGQSRKGANAGHVFHCQDMRCEAGGKQMKSVWRFSTRGAEKSFGKHPTQEPAVLVDRYLRASANVEDWMLDPSVASGTTGLAARRLGQTFIGVDNQPDYLAIAVERINCTDPSCQVSEPVTATWTDSHPLVKARMRLAKWRRRGHFQNSVNLSARACFQ